MHDCLNYVARWEPGPKPFDGMWAPYWYKNTHKSTGFEQPKKYPSVSNREIVYVIFFSITGFSV